MVRFNQSHMKTLERTFNLTQALSQGFDSINSESIASILTSFNWAMNEGSASLIHKDAPSNEVSDCINFVGEYCHQNKINYDILLNEKDNCFHLYLY